MSKQAVAINLRMLKTLVIDFLVFKPQFLRRLSRVFFSASSRLSRNFRGRLAGLEQIAAAGRLSRRLRGLAALGLEAEIWKARAPTTIIMFCIVAQLIDVYLMIADLEDGSHGGQKSQWRF